MTDKYYRVIAGIIPHLAESWEEAQRLATRLSYRYPTAEIRIEERSLAPMESPTHRR
jgi:hypothetical protein